MPDKFIVITGGPSSGKSTLIGALARSGFAVAPESGRQIIKEQVAAGGTALPWADRSLFAEEMLKRDIETYRSFETVAGLVFFDRGILDVLGYLTLCGLPVPPHMRAAAVRYRYHPRVFIAPPWPDIFTQDAERKQTLDEAERTYQMLARTYSDAGCELVEVPRVSVEERARFVRDRCAV
ncbi:MAG: AAA family ATPase [Xanthobacteraceae bacterium]